MTSTALPAFLPAPFAAVPADRPRAEAGVLAAYAAAGLPAPAHLVWAPSPAAGAILSALLRTDLAAGAEKDLTGLLTPAILAALDRDAAGVRGVSPFGGDASGVRAWLLSLGAGAPVRDLVRTRPWEARRAAAYAELGPEEWARAWARTGGRSWEQVNALVTRIRRAIGELGERPGEDGPIPLQPVLLRGATLDAVLGQHDAPWLELFDSTGGLGPLHGLAEAAQSAGWWWPYENLVILTERPTDLHRDEPGRLHRGDGPALAYPDGFALHAWRGMPIPPDFIATLGTLTARQILNEDNAELRRVMLEHFGYDRYLAEINAKPLHRDATGTLWRIDLPGDEPIVMVEVLNSTPEPDGTTRTYYLRVPPSTQTARAGVAWTFGLTEDTYHPEKET